MTDRTYSIRVENRGTAPHMWIELYEDGVLVEGGGLEPAGMPKGNFLGSFSHVKRDGVRSCFLYNFILI